MIYEVVSYTFKPGMINKWEANFAEALPYRSKYSELGGIWHTDIGPLNQMVVIWPYESNKQRDEVNAKLLKEPNWPPKGGESIINQNIEIYTPAAFSPKLGGGQKLGSIYEMRIYRFQPGSIPAMLDAFSVSFQDKNGRLKLSPLALMAYSSTGDLNRLMHIWPYKDYAERTKVRSQTKNIATWPPKGLGEYLIGQENKIIIPASCSPMS